MTGTGTGTMTGTGTGTGTMTGIMNIKKIIFLYQLVLQQVRNNLTIQSKLRLQIFCLKSLHSSHSFLLESLIKKFEY